MLIYILKSAACLAILFLFYKLFLERENMHVFKRFYLLGALLFALIVPAIIFTEYVVVEPQAYEAPLQTSSVMVESTPDIPPALEADITDIAPLLWIIYFIGLFFFGIKFLRNLFQIFRRIHRNPKYKKSSFIQVLLQEKIPPHTFFKYIFLNKSKFESKEIPKEVILHEETHAKQKHSLDVVFIELLQVIFWINPLIYFFKKAIKLNHEFLADSAVLKKNVDAVTYQNTLLSFLSSESAKKYQPSLPNAINYSSIKKRFTIMKSKTSKKSIVLRSFLLLPLLGMLLVGFTETKLIEVAPEVEIPAEKLISSGELIQISINGKGQLLIENNLVLMQDLDSFILKLNHDLLREKGTEIVRAKIIVTDNSPKSTIANVERILEKHSIDQINILGPESETPPPSNQEGATKKQVQEYNALAKKYNAVAIEERKIPGFELTVLELAYRNMSPKQKKLAQPFPECLPQEGAMKVQLQEYNILAKRYNSMIDEEESIWIKKGDVARLEYLHGLMSDEQKANAEPFPDFPEPPPPPIAPKEIEEIEEEMIEMEREMEKQEEAMKEQEGAMIQKEHAMREKEHAMKEQEAEMERQERIIKEQEIQTDFPSPPTLAYRVDQKKVISKELKKMVDNYVKKSKAYRNAAGDYLNLGKGNEEKIRGLYNNLLEIYNDYKLLANEEGVFAQAVPAFSPKIKKGEKSDIPTPPSPVDKSEKEMAEEVIQDIIANQDSNDNNPGNFYSPPNKNPATNVPGSPPPPPEPESPIDHIIKMAKQDAIFYYKRKKITSDEAIDILQKNKKLSISTSKTNDERPVVKIVKHL